MQMMRMTSHLHDHHHHDNDYYFFCMLPFSPLLLALIASFLFFFLLAGKINYSAAESTGTGTYFQQQHFISNNNHTISLADVDGDESMNRMGAACSKESIYIFQGPTSPLPNGIPTYTVQIENVCVSGSCSIANIHLSCGWFSSARLINPNVFRRLCYDDCLVNNGEPLSPGESLSFQYANTFQYPMSVSSVACY